MRLLLSLEDLTLESGNAAPSALGYRSRSTQESVSSVPSWMQNQGLSDITIHSGQHAL